MNPAHIHLLSVHLPTVLCPVALALLAVRWVRTVRRREERDVVASTVESLAHWFVLLSAVVAGVAYFSGPPAFEMLDQELSAVRDLVLLHAAFGRAAFFGTVLMSLVSLQVLVRLTRSEPVPGWLRVLAVAGLAAVCSVLAWTAHLGGRIRHPEIG